MLAPETLLQNRYLVLEHIGHGGMGAVYKATDQRFGSTVALKETFFDDASLRRAFEREAHLLNRLRHPALPRVSDHFNEGDGQFLVMEYIHGEDLSEMLEKRGAAFPVEQVMGWADQLLDALDYLHTQEPPVIHRDIKPQNLKLASRNQIVLLDFGLAKGTPAALSRASAAASVFGFSRNYAPLEQMQGTGTDPRSDIYSLAATLYHLLTGTPPPDALTRAMATVDGHADPLRPAHEIHAQVTPSVGLALARAMAQSAAQRFQSAAEMREALASAARRVEDERASTVINAPAVSGLQEQETQLLHGRTSAAPTPAGTRAEAAETPASAAATNVASRGATSAHAAGTIAGLTADATNVARPAPHAASVESDSVVTRVRPAHARRGGLSSRTLGAAAGVVVLLLVAGALYAYTQRARPSAPAPSEQPAQQAASTPEPQPTPAASGAVEQAAPTPASEGPAPAQSKQTTATPRPSKRAQSDESQDDEPDMGEVEVPEVPEPGDPNAPRTMTPEEREQLRRLPRQLRRMVIEEQRKALRQRRQAIEEEKRRRRLEQPTPP